MKVTKVDRTRIAVGKTGASRTVSGLLYRNPNNGSNLETMEDQIAERIRKANFLYSIFFRRKETDSETRKFQAEFSALIKDMVKVRGVEAAYKSEKQERIDEAIGNQIKFLLEKESISYKLRRDQITKRMGEIAYNYRTEDAFQDALDQNFLSMRKSLKRGTNHWVAAHLMTGFANRNHLTLKKVVEDLDATKHEELVKFIDAVNRDYYKTAILKSIRRINVKVQPRKDILSLTSAANEKHKGLNDTLNDYASSPARADETLLSIKKILFAYFLPDDSKAEADFLKPENLWNIPRRDETFFDSFFPSEEPVNSSKNGSNTELYVLFDKDKIDDKAVKKRINYVNYGTFLARKAEASSDRDEYWISYIK
jgi:hypothetical protein